MSPQEETTFSPNLQLHPKQNSTEPPEIKSPTLENDGPIDTSTPKQDLEGEDAQIDLRSTDRAVSGLGVTYEPLAHNHNEFSVCLHDAAALTLELTPLLLKPPQDLELGDRDTQKPVARNKSNVRWIFFTLWIVTLLSVLFVAGLVTCDLQSLLNRTVVLEIDAVSILNITDLGVAAHVVGKVKTNYDNIDNPIYRYTLQAAGLMIGTVIVTFNEPVQVSFGGPGFERVHVVDLLPAEMALDLRNHRISPLDFISDAKFVESGLQTVLHDVLAHRKEEIHMEIKISLTPSVSSHWLHFKSFPISIFHHLQILPNETQIPVTVTDVTSEFGKNFVYSAVSATLDPLPLQFSLKPVDWNIYLRDCDGKPSILGVLASEDVFFEPGKLTMVNFTGAVTQVPQQLLQTCSDGLNPFNKFIKQLFEENIVHVWVSASKSDKNTRNLMPWLYSLLTEAVVEIKAPIPEQKDQFMQDFVSEFAIELMDIVVPRGTRDNVVILVGLKSSAKLGLITGKTGFLAIASEIDSHLTVWNDSDDEKVLLATITGGDIAISSTCAKECLSFINSSFDAINVTVMSPELMGRAISRILDGQKFLLYQWVDELNRAHIALELLSTEFRNIRIGYRKTTHNYENFNMTENNNEDLYINSVIANANILIERVTYITSTSEELMLLVDFEATNPVNFSLVMNDAICFEYHYNQTQIGKVSIDEVSISRISERQGFSAQVTVQNRLKYTSDFLSQIVSGNRAAVDIQGSIGVLGLGKVIENVHARHVCVPALKFKGGTEDVEKEETGLITGANTLSNPFLVSAIIHIWSSDVELFVYNPLCNVGVAVKIELCHAYHKGELLAYAEDTDLILVPPGIYKTPRIPIQISKGLGTKILKKVINGKLQVEVVAQLKVFIGRFSTDLKYHGQGLTAAVRL